MNICYFLTNIKYFYFFHKLLFDIILHNTFRRLTGINSTYLIDIINSDIKNNGFVIIKLVQWLLCRYTNLMKTTNKHSNMYKFLENFKDVYENCNLHDFEYTKNTFLKDFSKNINDIIDIDKNYKLPSASIAQVYKGTLKSSGEEIAVKVTHPELENQMIYPLLYYNLYCYITKKFKFLNKYTIPFDLTSFFKNFIKQIDMNNEAKNLEYFYNEYKENPLVLIPKPLFCSKNILVMQYIHGDNFEKKDISKYQQYKYVLYVNLFVRNNLINLDKIHADLHSSNWKIVTTNKIPKIVVYDFGFCIEIPKKSRTHIHNINKAIETNNHMLFAKSIYNYLKTNCSKDIFLKDAEHFMNSNKNSINITNYIEFCINKNYIFTSDILDLTLSSLLVNNYFHAYISNKNIELDFEQEELDSIKKLENTNNHLMTLSSICDINNCYDELNIFLKKFVDENRVNIIEIRQKNIVNNLNRNKSNEDFIDL